MPASLALFNQDASAIEVIIIIFKLGYFFFTLMASKRPLEPSAIKISIINKSQEWRSRYDSTRIADSKEFSNS